MNKPRIGITGNFGPAGCELAEGYYDSIVRAGGVPLVIPPCEDEEVAIGTLASVDALLLSGGGDINPLLVGEEPSPLLRSICPKRDKQELMLARLASDMQMPMLGICRGVQVMACALGGAIHQDISHLATVKHSQDAPRCEATHTVTLEGILRDVYKRETLPVNSFHHQAVRDTGPHFKVAAQSKDGIVEAIASTECKPIIGVQWHPECMPGSEPLFEWLVSEAMLYQQAISIHKRILTLDSHCDTAMKFGTEEERLVTFPLMKRGRLDVTTMVAYIPQREAQPTKMAIDTLNAITAYAGDRLCRTAEELYEQKRKGEPVVMLGIENGAAIGDDLSLIERFRQMGVTYMTLCHNGDNQLCDSAKGEQTHGGLSSLGCKAIDEMNRVGMMVDLSHAAESTFWQALEASEMPPICSHSSCRALCNHPRNLTDEQMRALAERGGVMQVTLYDGFLREGGGASVEDAVKHIKHARDVMGIDHIGIGTDFDGDGGVPGVANAGELLNLTRLLLKEGFTEDDLRKLWGANYLRLMNQWQKH